MGIEAEELLELYVAEVRARGRDAAIFAGEADKISVLTRDRDEALKDRCVTSAQLRQTVAERDALLTTLTLLFDASHADAAGTDNGYQAKLLSARIAAGELIKKLDPIPF